MIIGQPRVKPSKGDIVTWQGKQYKVLEVGLRYVGLEDIESGHNCGHLVHVNELQIVVNKVEPELEEDEG